MNLTDAPAPHAVTTHRALPAGPWAVRDAREAAVRALADRGVRCPARTAEDIVLIVSELATNAVLHARPPYALTLRLEPGRAGIVLSDGSASPPRRTARPGPTATRGRGLGIVRALGADLFVSPSPHGKQVIAVLTWPVA
ncbi:ATP-binding protein [Streptomyces sp. NPDC047014]|uniref:ATP-binding protein n=1 Tax=Streptomyces sp. NPDC047014 TaxID=3155736 RepID=UPI0033CFDA5A